MGFCTYISSTANIIESNSCKIPAIYSFAINSLISKEEKSEGIYKSLENDDLESFCRKIDKASKINRLSCSKCHSRNLHVMKIKEGIYFPRDILSQRDISIFFRS